MDKPRFISYIRQQYAALCDQSWSDDQWEMQISIGPGWHALVDECLSRFTNRLGDDAVNLYSIRQIKEKFASLRCYVMPVDGVEVPENLRASLDSIRDDIERRSAITCEVCGAPGSTRRDHGYHVTLCDLHLAERIARRRGDRK
jgi:hypothetical protein